MPEFEYINHLYWLLLIPGIGLLFAASRLIRRSKLKKYASAYNLKQLMQNYSKTKVYFKLILFMLGFHKPNAMCLTQRGQTILVSLKGLVLRWANIPIMMQRPMASNLMNSLPF